MRKRVRVLACVCGYRPTLNVQTRPGRQQAFSGGGRHTDDRSAASVRGTINGSAAPSLRLCTLTMHADPHGNEGKACACN